MTHEFKAGDWAMVQVVEVSPHKLWLQDGPGPYITISAANLRPIPSPPDPARAAAERAVVETALGWADGRNGETALTEATTALRALDTPENPVKELLAAGEAMILALTAWDAGGSLSSDQVPVYNRWRNAVKAARKEPV